MRSATAKARVFGGQSNPNHKTLLAQTMRLITAAEYVQWPIEITEPSLIFLWKSDW
jgi:hypothetical protein